MPLPDSFAELQAGGGVMVHLPRLRWRAEYSLGQLRKAGFKNIVLEDGIDGQRTEPRACARDHGWLFDPGASRGEIACALTMLALWQRVVDEGRPYLLVFEDDVLPHPDVAEVGASYWADTPRDAEFVFLGNAMDPDAVAREQRAVVAFPSWCLHAYVVTREGAERVLGQLRDQLQVEDRWLSPLDVELRHRMVGGRLKYVCWNGALQRKAYSTSEEVRRAERRGERVDGDVARAGLDTGLFFQNYRLGSAIWPEQYPHVGRGTARPSRSRRPRAVLISSLMPKSSGNGLAMRAGVALQALASDYDVDVLVPPFDGSAWTSGLASECASNVIGLPGRVADPFFGLVTGFSQGDQLAARLVYPRPAAAMWSTAEAADEAFERIGPDVDLVYVVRSYMAPLAEPWLRHVPRQARFVLDLDEDDESARSQLADLLALRGDVEGEQLARADAAKLGAMAARWVRSADLVLASTPDEVADIRARHPSAPVDLLPNPAPPTGEEGMAQPVDLLFAANLGYFPNVDAAQWLCEEVVPRLRKQLRRDVRVALVGSAMDPLVGRLAGKGVVVVADPPSVTPWYRAAKISVVPIRAARGSRLKILEAFAHRRAVVTTTAGAGGLAVQDGVHLLIADTADGIAAACKRLLTDDHLRSFIVDQAVDIAIEHAWPEVMNRLIRILRNGRPNHV